MTRPYESLFRCIVFRFFFLFGFPLLLLHLRASCSLHSCFFFQCSCFFFVRCCCFFFVRGSYSFVGSSFAFSFEVSIVFICVQWCICVLPISIVYFFLMIVVWMIACWMTGLLFVKNPILRITHMDYWSVWFIRIVNLYEPYRLAIRMDFFFEIFFRIFLILNI